MIEITREPEELGPAVEKCVFCRKTTPYWAEEGDVPVCKSCAKLKNPVQLPKKKDWMKMI